MKNRIEQLRRILGNRELIYIGPRGVDSHPLLPLDCLGAVISLIAPSQTGVFESCLELESGTRPDLNSSSLDESLEDATSRQRQALFSRLASSSAVLPYQPNQILSVGRLIFRETTLPLGLFWEKQTSFDFKPWVELEMQKLGVKTIPWEYTRNLSETKVVRMLDGDTSVVIRSSRSKGGSGLLIANSQDDLQELSGSFAKDEYLCVAPFLIPSLPVNVNACAFPGGEVSIHGSSVQLIGIGTCTSRPLGYAGNDFGAIRNLSKTALLNLECMTRTLGSWLASQGFLGAFGMDALVKGEDIYFVELNPRFQASSAIAARIDEDLFRSNQYFEHAAAFLGLPPSNDISLTELVKKQENLAQVIIYNCRDKSVCLTREPAVKDCEIRLLPRSGITVAPQGILAAICVHNQVTQSGRELSPEAEETIRNLINCFTPPKVGILD